MKFDQTTKVFVYWKQCYIDNMMKAYSYIWTEFTTEEMQTKIENESDLQSTIQDKQIKLLERCKRFCQTQTTIQHPTKTSTTPNSKEMLIPKMDA